MRAYIAVVAGIGLTILGPTLPIVLGAPDIVVTVGFLIGGFGGGALLIGGCYQWISERRGLAQDSQS